MSSNLISSHDHDHDHDDCWFQSYGITETNVLGNLFGNLNSLGGRQVSRSRSYVGKDGL